MAKLKHKIGRAPLLPSIQEANPKDLRTSVEQTNRVLRDLVKKLEPLQNALRELQEIEEAR